MAVMVSNAGVPSRRQLLVVGPAVLIASGAAAAGGLGAAIGGLGASFDPVTLALAVTAGGLTLVAGVLASRRPWQLNQETSVAWLEYHDWRTVALNGAALGVGVLSRIGFWAWYVLPLGAFALGDPVLGAAGFAAYALVRLTLSAYLTARLSPGFLTARQGVIARVLDPVAAFSICMFVAIAWLNVSST